MQSSFQKQNSSLEQKALDEINKFKNQLLKEGYIIDEPAKKQYNYELNIVKGKDKIKLLVYFGKKGINKVLQGNINSSLYREIDSMLNSKFDFQIPEIEEPDEYIGSDESGKGDLFGPLVVAAFSIDTDVKKKISDLNIKDSKELSDNDISKIALELLKRFPEKISTIEIYPKRYNQLYESFQNMNSILIWAHSKAIERLQEKNIHTNLVIDKFCAENLIRNELSKKLNEYNLILTEKAERFTGVAVASIIARSKVINWFERKSKELGIKIPFGSAKHVNNVASHIKNKFGKEVLTELIKLHFKNFKNI